MEKVWKLSERMEKVNSDLSAMMDFIQGDDETEVDEAIATCEYKLEQKRTNSFVLILHASSFHSTTDSYLPYN